MEGLKIPTKRNGTIEFGQFDRDKELEFEYEDSGGIFNYDWLSVEQVKQLTRHLIAALDEIGEKI